MPSVSFDSKSFLLQSGRAAVSRFAVAGAVFDPLLIDPEEWAATLARLRHAGFNTVVMRAPWIAHEPTPDRFVFSDAADLRRAIELAGAAGLKVIVRIGPCVGGGFAGGGLPGWVADHVGGRVREANLPFLARVTRFWRALAPRFIDLQATRNGSGSPRPVIAVGIEDDWRCLDAEVGEAYFGALVRFAREVGIDVPLLTANNCWYTHEGLIDAWTPASAEVAHTAAELRQVHPDAAPFFLLGGGGPARDLARDVVDALAARADFVCDVLGGFHRGATSARGCAQRAARDLFSLRRAVVQASTFGHVLRAQPKDAPGVGFELAGLQLNGATIEKCTGSPVAVAGDVLVVAGAPRSRITLKVDGSEVAITVPADGAALKLTKVRGLRVAAVPTRLADGIGIADPTAEGAGLEFVDREGALLARVGRDGVRSVPPASSKSSRTRSQSLRLSDAVCVVERALLDGTHTRYARMAGPHALGELGVQSMHGFLRARFETPRRRNREVWFDGRGIGRTARVAVKPRGTMLACEVRADFLPPTGSHADERVGIIGPLREAAPLKGARPALVDLPRFDATRLGRFVWGYDARSDSQHRRTVRWTFPARDAAVVVRMPDWWFDEGHASLGHAMRLNDAIVPTTAWCARASVVLDGALLSPMRPRRLAKGEKPPRGKAIKLEPAANELLLDLDPHATLDERMLKRLVRDVVLLDVGGELAAEWAFARVDPPAGWASAVPVPRKPLDAPAWFRTLFRIDAPRSVGMVVTHAPGAVATLLVNGQPIMSLDGVTGELTGTARTRRLVRNATIPASMLRAGENELCIFEPDGVMPAIALR